MASTAMIETFAGSLGEGPATAVAQTPNAVACIGHTVFISDGLWSAIRALDLRTGHERVAGAGFANPVDVAADPAGNLFIVDYGHHRILRLDPGGTVRVVTGTGEPGFGGDGGPASAAQLNTPNGVSVDAAGNLYIADTNNQRVRRVAADGTMSTYAGSGAAGYAGDSGPATQARFSSPSGVHVDDAGNVFVADTDNHCIRRIDAGGTITTLMGTGTAGFSGDGGPAASAQLNMPFGVFAGRGGFVYIPDFGNERVRRVAPDGTASTFAGTGQAGFSGDGGPATAAQLRSVTDIAEDADGNLYVSDLSNNRVRRITPDGTIDTVAGNGRQAYSGDDGPATAAQMLLPGDVEIDGQTAYVADARNHRVRAIDAAGVIRTVAGIGRPGFGGDGDSALQAVLNRPACVVADRAGGYYLTDRANHRIRRVDAAGTIRTVAGTGTMGDSVGAGPAVQAALAAPTALALGDDGVLWIADTLNHRVRRLELDGTMVTAAGVGSPGYCNDGGKAAHAHLNTPLGLAIAPTGELHVADSANHRIRKVDPTGLITTVAGTGEPGFGGDGGPATAARLAGPSGIAFDAGGRLYIVDTLNQRVRVVDPAGTITTFAGDGRPGLGGDGGPATSAQLALAPGPGEMCGIVVTSDGRVYVADSANHRIRRVAAAAAAADFPPYRDLIAAAGAPEAAGQPAVVTSGGSTRVVYRGRDRHIHELLAD